MQGAGRLRRIGCVAAVLTLAAIVNGVGAQEPAAASAPGRVWASDIHDVGDGERGSGAPSISITAARNGAFSGKVVVGAGQVTRAAVSDLKQGAATIPASGIRVRYGVMWDQSIGSWTCPRGNDILLEAPPETASAKLPVWVTVKVPKDAKPGVYTGQLRIELKGGGPVTVPVAIDVQDWTLPDPQDYRTWVELVHQPDTLAVEYNVPLWSEKHWEMVAKSLQLTADTGSRVIYIPLIARTNYGNAESMVRWVKKSGGGYEYDFSTLDRYLDLVDKHLGKPKIAFCYAWEVYLVLSKKDGPVEIKGSEGSYEWKESSFASALVTLKGKGPAVTVVDPSTRTNETVYLPRYEDPASKELWQPVWAGVRKRLADRGWEKSMMLGNLSDLRPIKEEVAVLNELSGGLPWTSCSHHFYAVLEGKSLGKVHGIADVGYVAVALDFQFTINPAKERTYGWKKPFLHAQYWRFQYFNTSSHPGIRNELEWHMTGCQRGIGHLGADFWPCIRNKAGRRAAVVTDRFPESYWHSLNIGSYMLGPGPAGPAGTSRLEVFREGLQECEARIAIETALTDETLRNRLGDDLARRAQELLDERQLALWKARGTAEADLQLGTIRQYRTVINEIGKRADGKAGLAWFFASNWQERSARLFAMAGEVEKKLAAR